MYTLKRKMVEFIVGSNGVTFIVESLFFFNKSTYTFILKLNEDQIFNDRISSISKGDIISLIRRKYTCPQYSNKFYQVPVYELIKPNLIP